jgi:c-di-GMP-binding flagellar brake protein YcgR
MANEARKYKRIKSSLNIRVIVPDGGQGLRGMITGKSKNISATGVLFYNETILEIGTVVNIKFLKPDGLDFFEGDAKVVRVEIPSDSRGYEMGVQFINLSADEEKKLNYYLLPE